MSNEIPGRLRIVWAPLPSALTIPTANFFGPPQLPRCDGITWPRPFSRFRLEYWNTRELRNGTYRVTVDAYDLAGNIGSKTVTVAVKN